MAIRMLATRLSSSDQVSNHGAASFTELVFIKDYLSG